jgi:hypothetical protein
MVFVVAMAFGMILYRAWEKRRAQSEQSHASAVIPADG